VTNSDKRTSLPRYEINCGPRKVFERRPECRFVFTSPPPIDVVFYKFLSKFFFFLSQFNKYLRQWLTSIGNRDIYHVRYLATFALGSSNSDQPFQVAILAPKQRSPFWCQNEPNHLVWLHPL